MVDLHKITGFFPRMAIECRIFRRQSLVQAGAVPSGKQSFQPLVLAEAVIILVEGSYHLFDHPGTLSRTSSIESEKMPAGYPVARIDSGLYIMIGHIEGGTDPSLQNVEKMPL